MIDGMDGIDACYHFAGIIGIRPHGLTLRQLWRMADGRLKQDRSRIIESASLMWGANDIDLERYLHFGDMNSTGRGGPVKLSEEMQHRVDMEIEKTRQENPDLPKFKGMQ